MTDSSPSLCTLLWLSVLAWGSRSCHGFDTFGFDVHHRYSDPVKEILAVDDLPEKGSLPYYAAMARRDQLIHRRGFAAADDGVLTFAGGNETFQISSLGFLHYANVSVGTPSSWYLVALDTGSDLFWLPCECTSCVHGLPTLTGDILELNIYSPTASSTSAKVPCDSTMCAQERECSSSTNDCPYHVLYMSNDTSSTGILVEDVLRLTTDDTQSKAVDAHITFGCGKVQTGSFLDGAAPNGLFGLGTADISIPSTLADKGIASNSFSLCFGPDGAGRISFGDKGSSDQGETPFTLREPHPTYHISMTQITMGSDAHDLEFSAIFDSGTSFTYLNDPAYTLITESFNSEVNESRRSSNPDIPFEYCYDLSSNQADFSVPTINLTMKGGDHFDVTDPVLVINYEVENIYCLGIIRSGDINIIGQNFMTGHRIVFDREKMVLGWKTSDCFVEESNTLPINTPNSNVALNPQAIAGRDNGTDTSAGDPNSSVSRSARSISLTPILLTILSPILCIV